MRVDAARPDELDSLTEQWVDLAGEQAAHDTHVLAAENRATAREMLAHHLAVDGLLVARPESGGRDDATGGPTEPVGFVTFSLQDGSYTTDVTRGVVENLYVRPGNRNEGIGSLLLAAAEDRLSDRGADVVTLEAMAGNDAARRFYERAGYAVHRVVYEKSLRDESDTKGD